MDDFRIDFEIALKSSPIIYIPHFDYELIDRELEQAVSRVGLDTTNIAEYDLNRGIVAFDNKNQKQDDEYVSYQQLDVWLECIIDAENTDYERVFLFKNFQQEVLGDYKTQLQFQTFAAKHKHGDYAKKGEVYTIIIVSPMAVMSLPNSIEKIITVLDYPLPSIEEIQDKVSSFPIAPSVTRRGKTEQQFQEELTYSMLGLHMYEVEQILRTITTRSYNGKLDNSSISFALQEKQRIVKKSGIIEVVETDVSFDEVGGLEKLKSDLCKKALLYRNLNEIKDRNGFNLPVPKGVLIIGMPGCGKTMIAKAVAQKFRVSLLRLDINRLMGQYVGMSEENLRRALQTAETAHPCVLWIDEVEKAFAGAGANGGDNDMLVQRLMGQFLTWMQERKTAVYIVATANDVMRPEFMRKGRFDEVYFVDFPNLEERKAILKSKMNRYGFLTTPKNEKYDFSDFITEESANDNFNKLASMMTGDGKNEKNSDGYSIGFSGAEIESVVNQVMENAYVKYRLSIEKNQPVSIPIKINLATFEEVIKSMRPSVMANQIVLKQDKLNNPNKATNIERIRDMQKTYHFTNASE